MKTEKKHVICGAGLPNTDGSEPWFWCVLARGHADPHTDGERTWLDTYIVEVTTVEEVRAVAAHAHDFVGDEETCVRGCPMSWAEYQRFERSLE